MSWLSHALMILVTNFYSLNVLSACFPFSSNLFHQYEMSDISPAETILKILLSFVTSASDFKESLWGVSNCRARGTDFQSSPPVPKHCQNPIVLAEAFTSPHAPASMAADGMAPVPSKASPWLLPAT